MENVRDISPFVTLLREPDPDGWDAMHAWRAAAAERGEVELCAAIDRLGLAALANVIEVTRRLSCE